MKIDVEESKIYSFNDPSEDLYMCGALNVGRKGYFSDRPDFKDMIEGVLNRVTVEPGYDADDYYPFKMGDAIVGFKFFCPEECPVGTPELRPYRTLDELPFKVGDSVTFREKGEKEELMMICVGTMVDGAQLEDIHLGAYVYEPGSLFEGYEYFNGKEWVPFGVEA